MPDYLYQLWFYVSVPGVAPSTFETPRQKFDVRPQRPSGAATTPEMTSSSLKSGRRSIEFLEVEFDVAIDLPDDVILAGRKSADGVRWNHVVESRRRRPQTAAVSGSGSGVRKLPNNVFVAAVDFDRPFGYSTSTWVQGSYNKLTVPL